MATRIKYVGLADQRVIRVSDFAAAGLTSTQLLFTRNNPVSVPDDIAVFLLSMGDFLTDDGLTLGQALTAGFGGRYLGGTRVETYQSAVNSAITFILGSAKTVTVGPRGVRVLYGGFLGATVALKTTILLLRLDSVVVDWLVFHSSGANLFDTKLQAWTPTVNVTPGDHTFDLEVQADAGATCAAFGSNVTPTVLGLYDL